MAAGDTPERIGVRIARERKRRGLTQLGLAQRANYSRSHIAQVEAGHKMAPPAFIAAVAAALGVSPARLYGQPFYENSPVRGAVHTHIPEIRRVLALVDVPPDLEGPPRRLTELDAELAMIRRLQVASRYSRIGERLPALLQELSWHAHHTEQARVWHMLFLAQEAAADLCRKLGYHDLAGTCLDRAAESARRAQDPHLPLLVVFRRSLLLLAVAQWRSALTLLDRAVRAVDHSREDAAEVLGTAHLRAAIAAARAGDAATAWDHHGQAVEIRRRAGRAPGDRHGITTGFVTGNVAIHGAAVAVELGDMDEAVRRDRRIHPRLLADLPPERRAHHEIDMSRALLETGDYGRALQRLEKAEQIAPQLTYFHPSARSAVAHLVDVRRTLPEPLRRLQSHMGV